VSVWAILVAAGRGERLGLDHPKAFAKLGEDPLLAEPLRRLDDSQWVDLPASYHDRGCMFSFADGHAEIHKWMSSDTLRPPDPDAALLPFSFSEAGRGDFNWIAERTSIER